MTRRQIGKELKRIRLGKKLSAWKASKLAGIRVETIQDIEGGKENYQIDSLIKYCQALEATITLT